MYIFGITGPIGHGKSTLAYSLAKLGSPYIHMESSIVISEVANEWLATFPRELLIDPIDYALLNSWFDNLATVVSHQITKINTNQLHITHEQVLAEPKYIYKLFMYFNLVRQGVIPLGEPITEKNKDRHRPILQWIGGYLVHRIGPGIWYDEIGRRIQKAKNDGIKIYIVGGIRYPYDAAVIRSQGGIIIKLFRADLPERELADITEEHRNEILVDTTIISDSNIKALDETVKAFYQDLLLRDILSTYHSNDFLPLVD